MVALATQPLPVPSLFKRQNAEDWGYRPNEGKIFADAGAWAEKHGIRPSSTDAKRVHLLLIDLQKDFVFPQGTLYVGGRSGKGAIEDNQRIAEFVYRNMARISEITATLDTHLPYQIFYPSFWLGKDGQPLQPFTTVLAEQIKSGDVRPNPAVAPIVCNGNYGSGSVLTHYRNYGWLTSYVRHYCEALEKAGKYQLFLWPFHCLIGSDGHALAGVIEEARVFHAFARRSPNLLEIKGGSPFTENYSVLSPEVLVDHDGRPLAGVQRNVKFIEKLIRSEVVVIAGQAASHCVKSSIEDLLSSINAQDPKLCRKVYILKDCMSAVTVPDGKGGFFADYTPNAEKALKMFADAGMNVVESTVPMDQWPGFPA